jgi:hypothetical protein
MSDDGSHWEMLVFFAFLVAIPGPGRPGRLSDLSVSHSKSFFDGGFVWARRALNREKRRFLARAVVGLSCLALREQAGKRKSHFG